MHEMSFSMNYFGIPLLEPETWSDGSLGHAEQLHSYKNQVFHDEKFEYYVDRKGILV